MGSCMRRIIICLMLVFFSGTAIASGSPPKIGLPQWQEIYNCAPPSSLPSSLPRVLVEGKYVYIYNDKIADKVEFSIQDIKPRKPRTVGPIDSNEKVELGRVRIPVPPTIDGKGFSIEGIDVGLFHDKRAMQPQYYYKDRSLTKHRGMAIDRERSRVTYIDAKLSKTLDQKYWSESHFDQDAINFVLLYLSAGASSDDKVKDQKCAEVTKRYLRDPNFSGLYVKLSQRITLRSLNVGVALDKKSAKSSFIMENMTGQTIPLVGGSGCMNRDYLFKTKGDWDVVHKHTTPQLFCAAFFHTFCGNCSGVVSHELQANTANPLRVQFYLAGDPNIATEVFQTNRDYSPVQVRMPNKPKLDKLDQNEKIIHDVFSKNNFEITSLNKAFGSRPNLIEVIFKDLKEEYFDDKSLLFESFRLEDNETLTKFRNKIEAREIGRASCRERV